LQLCSPFLPLVLCVADSAIPGGVTTVVDATHVVLGADSVAAVHVSQGEGVAAACVASPSTPGVSSEATANGRLGIDDADDATHVLSYANGMAAADVRELRAS